MVSQNELNTLRKEAYNEAYIKALNDFEAKIKECCSIVGSCDFEDMESIKEQLKNNL